MLVCFIHNTFIGKKLGRIVQVQVLGRTRSGSLSWLTENQAELIVPGLLIVEDDIPFFSSSDWHPTVVLW